MCVWVWVSVPCQRGRTGSSSTNNNESVAPPTRPFMDNSNLVCVRSLLQCCCLLLLGTWRSFGQQQKLKTQLKLKTNNNNSNNTNDDNEKKMDKKCFKMSPVPQFCISVLLFFRFLFSFSSFCFCFSVARMSYLCYHLNDNGHINVKYGWENDFLAFLPLTPLAFL